MNKDEKKAIHEMAEVIKHTERLAWNVVGARPSPKMIATDLYDKGYRRQSENTVEVVRCYDCKYCEVVVDSIIDEPKYFCTRMVGCMPTDPTDYCSRAKMKGGE